ncbi:phospholipid scramblase 1-like [Mercenaria mercenaria]|uniref:phospholipid scramblase 1-like n=1 Tax=Mercenaria mercenaria TaxID=6596 RepID=UPI00234E6DCC|nr:phospholipid scramblase 1-like [Mercenaria mercenaria]
MINEGQVVPPPPNAVDPEYVQQTQYGGQSIGTFSNPPATNLWMAKPESTVGCPSGLECLSIIDGLMVRQFMEVAPGRMGRPMVNNSWFKVENFMGQQIYFVTEDKDMSGVCLPGQRGYTFHLSDNLGCEVMRISRQPICCSCCPCCGCCEHLIQIEAPVGHTIGYIKSRKNCMSSLFAITNAEDEDIFSISFPLCSTSSPMHQQEFTIKSADGQSEIATITKPWGRMEFYYRLKDFSLKCKPSH